MEIDTTPNSDKQISFLLKLKNPSTYYKLCILISRFIKKDNYYDFLFHLLRNRNIGDAELFRKIKAFMKSIKQDTKSYLTYAAEKHCGLIHRFILAKNINSYLDLGCGKCNITGYIGEQMSLKKHQIFGTDVKQEFEIEWDESRKSNTMINFEYINLGKIPFKDEQFDVITCFMVLHHIPNVEKTIKDIHTRLRKNGILYIREHNCIGKEDFIFADLIHSMYILQIHPMKESEKLIKKQKNFYRSAESWSSLICSFGFEEVYFSQDPFSVSNNCKIIYKKT